MRTDSEAAAVAAILLLLVPAIAGAQHDDPMDLLSRGPHLSRDLEPVLRNGHEAAIQRCAYDSVRFGETETPAVVVRIVVDPRGVPTHLTIEGAPSYLERCLRMRFGRSRFPALPRYQALLIPLTFRGRPAPRPPH